MNAETIRKLAAAWADATCPEPQMRRDFMREIDKAVERNIDTSLVVGWKLTKSQTPYMVYLFAKHFFVFALTNRQAKDLGVHSDGMLATRLPLSIPTPAVSEYPFVINELKLDNCRCLNGSEVITGHLQYERMCPLPERVSLVLELNVKDRAMKRLYMYPPHPMLNAAGVVELGFPAVRSGNEEATRDWQGTTGAFCRFVTVCDPRIGLESQPLSSPYGVLLDVLPAQRHGDRFSGRRGIS